MSSEKKQNTGGKSHNDFTQKMFSNEHSKGIAFEGDGQRRCFGCMELYSTKYDVCPFCGYTTDIEVENALHMYPGMVLHDKYIIGKVIGYGGFGVTYLAWDTVLQTKVAIKEYLPSEFSTRAVGQTQVTVFSGDKAKQFNDGMEKFVDEAKRLAKFRNENGIVKIFDSFSENSTAYIAMEYLQGETLAQRLEREKTIPVEEAIQMLMPIIESLNRVHDEGIIHRDIAPDNIFLTTKGEVKLIDFGASRYATTSRSRSLTVIIKPGYSAEEQYRSRGDQGPHTDVYSVGACLYKMITGETPPDAMERRAQFEKNHKDMLKPIRKYVKDIDPRRENAIYNALNVRIEDRTPDMISLAGELTSEEPVKRRKSGIKKIDPLTWPLWAKIGIPSGLAAVIALCVLLAAGVIGPKSGLENQFYVPDGQTIVPNIVGFSEKKAEKKLKKYELNYMISDRVVSDTLSRDLILLQDPDAYNVANINSFVNVTKSDGHGMGTVPDVVGILKEEAQAELEKEGFKVKFVEKSSDIIAPGYIISQSEEAGTQLEKVVTEITLEVSTGTSDIDTSVEVVVPDLIGKKHDEAAKILNGLKLYIGVNYVYNEALPENEVVGQSPVKGEKAHQGDTITVTVNRGAMTVVVKSVVERKLDAAQAELEALGLNVYTKYVESETYDVGTIVAQSIAPGTAVKLGTDITLTVSEGKKVTVPNVVGKDKKAAIAAMQAVGLNCTFEYRESDKPKDQVLSQDPKSGQVVQMKSTIIVTLSGTGNGDDANAGSLVRIAIESKPQKTEYNIDEYFDDSGMKIVAYYGSGSSKDVTNECSCSQTGAFSKSGTQSVVFTYQEGGVTKTCSFSVRVNGVSVSLSMTNAYIAVGNSSELTATVTPERASLSWSSSKESVAKVSNGRVTAVAAGSAIITATARLGSDKATATCTITVTEGKIAVDSVELSESSLSLEEEQVARLTATPKPVNATVDGVKWSSGNTNVATVDSNGIVRAISEGTATVTATISGVKSNSCTVKVSAPKITSIAVADGTYPTQLYVGEHIDVSSIQVKVKYSNGSEKTVFGKDGGVSLSMTTNLNPNIYDIEVTYKGVSTTIKVRFMDAGVSINGSSKEMFTGATLQLSATTWPSGQKVSWSSSNTSVATVNQNGLVTGVKAGEVNIVAKIAFGSTTLSSSPYKITVSEKMVSKVTIASKPDKTSGYYIGDQINTEGLKLKIEYSDGSTAVVENGFEIHPKETVVNETKVTVKYGKFTPSFDVSSETPQIKLLGIKERVDEGETFTVTVKTEPEGRKVKWESSNTNVSLTQDGNTCKIKGVAAGSSGVQASFSYGNKEYSAGFLVEVKGRTISGISAEINKYDTTAYYIGDKIPKELITVKVKYSDGTESATTDFSIFPYEFSGELTKVDVAMGSQHCVTFLLATVPTITLEVTKKNNLDKNNAIYNIGDQATVRATLKPSDGWTNLSWSGTDLVINGKGEEVTVTAANSNGSKTVKLEANYKNNSYNSSVNIEVVQVEIVDWNVKLKSPNKKYNVGDLPDKQKDILLTVTYNDGTKKVDSLSTNFEVELSGEPKKETQEIKVTYNGEEKFLEIKVEEVSTTQNESVTHLKENSEDIDDLNDTKGE